MKKCNVIFLASVACAFGAWARTVMPEEAQSAARAWVSRGGLLGARFPSDVAMRTTAHTTTNDAVFYSVKMANGGTVFTSGDTTAEPVICFTSDTGDYSAIDKSSPLWALLNADVSSRQATARPRLALATAAAATQQTASSANEKKWAELVSEGEGLSARILRLGTLGSGIETVGDVRVDKLVQSEWDQSTVNGEACYNYYTPNGPNPDAFTPGAADNIVCGCVATAMAQIMCYWKYPSAEVQPQTTNCAWNTTSMELTTQGGLYDWENMTLKPEQESGLTEENRKAIGKLTSDAGISVSMTYNEKNSGSSGAYSSDVAPALKNTFGYKNANFFGSDTARTISESTYASVMFANFDAGCPVLMSIYGDSAGGHAIVGDGYGYNNDKAYVHLNMGWSGQDDLWYNVPDIETKNYQFTILMGVAYNIFPETTGQIVSGRILDAEGNALEGAKVVVSSAGTTTPVAEMTTKANGIYAFILARGTYDVHAESADGLLKEDLEGLELADANLWGNDMTLRTLSVRIGDTTYTSLDKALAAAQDGDAVEILLPTVLRYPVAVTNSCTVFATCEDAAASLVTRVDDAGLTIADGASVILSNVVFSVSTNTTLVTVQAGGCLTMDYGVDFGVVTNKGVAAIETVDAGGFVLAGVPSEVFLLHCAAATKESAAFGLYTCDEGIAEDAAKMILCADDDWYETRGHAVGGKLSWLVETVPLDEAGGCFIDKNGEMHAYKRMDRALEMFEASENATNLVFCKSGEFSRKMSITRTVVIGGADGVKITPTGDAAFAVTTGGDLTLTNIVFRNFTASKGKGFIEVNGCSLTLEKGAKLVNITGCVDYRSGVVDLLKGVVTMRPDAEISACRAIGAGYGTGYGGGIYVRGAGCTLNLEGGTIAGCHASVKGGGVYIGCDEWGVAGSVNLFGPTSVSGNTSVNSYKETVRDDIYVYSASAVPGFALAGELTDKVGIRFSGSVKGNKEGDAFMTNAVGMVSKATLARFFNDTDDTLEAATNTAGMLVWVKKDTSGTCDPDEAAAHVIYLNGTTNHYENFATAIGHMASNTTAKIEMHKEGRTGETLSSDIAFPAGCNLTLTSRGDAYAFDRDRSMGITIPATTSLTLTNVVFTRTQADSAVGNVTNALFTVRGGSLTLADGACVSNILGNSARDANAITVCEGGTVTTLAGSRIVHCSSYYNYKRQFDSDFKQETYGVGGGILVDGGTAYLHGGEIATCLAAQGGGVYVCNGSSAFVSGGMRIANNKWLSSDGEQKTSNVYVANQSTFSLDGELTDTVGTGDTIAWGGVGDTNVAARVSYDWTGNVDSLTNSAAHFVHDITSESGAAVTNGTEALIVWCGAAKGGAYTNRAGMVYALAGELPKAKAATLLPMLSAGASTADIRAELANLNDVSVAEKITTLEEYNAFAAWAAGVEGGAEAVAASSKAYVSYEFGTTKLLESEPKVEITEVENAGGGLTVSVVVKDGEDPVSVASAKVKEMFEATGDLGNWNAKIDLTVSDLTQSNANEVRFTVKPSGTPSKAFIRLRY